MSDKFILYIRYKGETFRRYGIGDIHYMGELLVDFVVINKIYDLDEVDFKITRFRGRE